MLEIYSLFRAARDLALAGGGDGEAWIVSAEYEWLADRFREIENDIRSTFNPTFTEECRGGNVIHFCDGQQFVAFTDHDPGTRPEAVFFIGVPLRH